MITSMMNSKNRLFKETRTIHEELLQELRARSRSGHHVEDFLLPSKYLSLVRNQGQTGTCSFVSCVACCEMVYRMAGRTVDGLQGKVFYFDVQDAFEHTYKNPEYREMGYVQEIQADTAADLGAPVLHVLRYLYKAGLLTSCVCADPVEKNPSLLMVHSPNRTILPAYRPLGPGEVISMLDGSPVIAVMKAYHSFMRCREVFFHGPTTDDCWRHDKERGYHTVLLVGKFALVSEKGKKKLYVILQNSHGRHYGYKGYVCFEFKANYFVEFWVAMANYPKRPRPSK